MGSVAAGKKMDCVAHYAIDKTGEIELQFKPAISMKKAASFKVNVQ